MAKEQINEAYTFETHPFTKHDWYGNAGAGENAHIGHNEHANLEVIHDNNGVEARHTDDANHTHYYSYEHPHGFEHGKAIAHYVLNSQPQSHEDMHKRLKSLGFNYIHHEDHEGRALNINEEVTASNLITLAQTQNPLKFGEAFQTLVKTRLNEAVLEKKRIIAESLFNEKEDTTEIDADKVKEPKKQINESFGHYSDHPKPVFHVRNEAQKALMDHEIKGQISDGAWENAQPQHHWHNWSSSEVHVRPDQLGRNFHAAKDNYGINRKDLLDIVGKRMKAHVRLGKAFGFEHAPTLAEHHLDLDGNFREDAGKYAREEKDPNGFWHKRERAAGEIHQKLGITPEHVKAAVENEHLYGDKEFHSDLSDLKKHMKVYNPEIGK